MDSGDPSGVGGVGYWRVEAARWRAGAEALAGWLVEAQRLAAQDVAQRARIADLEGRVGALTEKVSVLARMAFGKSSEKKTAKSVPGEDDPGDGAGSAGGAEGLPGGQPGKRGRGQRKGSRGHGRRDYSHLRTREEIHDVPEGERVCPCCGADYVAFGEESCEQIDWLVELIGDRASPPDLPTDLPLPGRWGAGRPAGVQGDSPGPVHHRVPGPAVV